MIVEFFGIPGGGKSTLARTYAERYPDSTLLVSLDMRKKFPEVLYGTLFALRHPVVFFWLMIFVMRYHMEGLFLYSFHMVVRASAKHQKASLTEGARFVFVDEGLIHVLCTIPASPLGKEGLKKWIERFAQVNLFLSVEEGDFHRFHNTHANLHPRVKRGDLELKKWELAVQENTRNVVSYLNNHGFLVWGVPQKGSMELDKKIALMHVYLDNL